MRHRKAKPLPSRQKDFKRRLEARERDKALRRQVHQLTHLVVPLERRADPPQERQGDRAS